MTRNEKMLKARCDNTSVLIARGREFVVIQAVDLRLELPGYVDRGMPIFTAHQTFGPSTNSLNIRPRQAER